MMKRMIPVLLAVLLLAGCGVPQEQALPAVTLPTLHAETPGPNDPNAPDASNGQNDPNATSAPNDPNAPQTPNASQDPNLPGGSDAHPEGSYYGEPVSALPESMFDNLLFGSGNSLAWKEEAEPAAGVASAPARSRVCAMITEDGETVTGWIAWTEEADGTWTCESEGVAPIAPVADPGAIAKYSPEEAEALLGPCQTGRYSESIAWYTRDGKLLTLYPYGVTELDDLLTGQSALYAEQDTVCVLKRADADTLVVNEARWQAFQESAARGKADAVTLRTVNGTAFTEVALSFDGQVYTAADENGSEAYACLAVSAEGPRSAQDKFSSAVYYLLSDDPEMTWDRYFGQKIASKPDPDFPRTRNLFTVYHYGD